MACHAYRSDIRETLHAYPPEPPPERPPGGPAEDPIPLPNFPPDPESPPNAPPGPIVARECGKRR